MSSPNTLRIVEIDVRNARSLNKGSTNDWGYEATHPSYDLNRGEVGSLRHVATEPHADEPRITWYRGQGTVSFRGEVIGWASLGSADRCYGVHVEYKGASLIRGDIEEIGQLWLLLRLFVSERILAEAQECDTRSTASVY